MSRYKNTFQRGVTQEEAQGVIPAEGGMAQTRGVPKTSAEVLSAQDKFRGVPMPGPSYDAPEPVTCAATTKRGAPCKGTPVKDGDLCMVHN